MCFVLVAGVMGYYCVKFVCDVIRCNKHDDNIILFS